MILPSGTGSPSGSGSPGPSIRTIGSMATGTTGPCSSFSSLPTSIGNATGIPSNPKRATWPTTASVLPRLMILFCRENQMAGVTGITPRALTVRYALYLLTGEFTPGIPGTEFLWKSGPEEWNGPVRQNITAFMAPTTIPAMPFTGELRIPKHAHQRLNPIRGMNLTAITMY